MTGAGATRVRKFPAWVWLFAGAIATALIATWLGTMLPLGWVSRGVTAAVLLTGTTVSALAYWRASRPDAGTGWRAELVGIVAFASVALIGGRSTSDLTVQGTWMHSLADVMQTFLAIGVALVLTRWLMGVDKREAAERSKTTIV